MTLAIQFELDKLTHDDKTLIDDDGNIFAAVVTADNVSTDRVVAKRLELPANIAAGLPGAAKAGLYSEQTVSGVASVDRRYTANYLNLNEVDLDPHLTMQGASAMYIGYGIGGGGNGQRTALNVAIDNLHGPTGDGTDTQQQFYTGVFSSTEVSKGDGGSAINARGDFYAVGTITHAHADAKFLNGVIGQEIDIVCDVGSSTKEKIALQLVTIDNDAVKGSRADAMIMIGGQQSTTATVDYGVVFGKPGHKHVVTGTLFGGYADTYNPLTANKGIDLSNFTFSDSAFRSNNFAVNQDGEVYAAAVHGGLRYIAATPAPVPPPAGQVIVYVDALDGKLKAKGPSGTVTVLAPPVSCIIWSGAAARGPVAPTCSHRCTVSKAHLKPQGGRSRSSSRAWNCVAPVPQKAPKPGR